MQSPAPLILTLALDPASQAWFDRMRSAHFPAERLQVGAHVTMFHALPGEHEAAVARCLAGLCANTAAFPVREATLASLGRGVAYRLQAAEAARLRTRLLQGVPMALTAQDQARWSPHITVQNKVSPEQARATLQALAAVPPPMGITATGLALWRYRGGPWEDAAEWAFSGT